MMRDLTNKVTNMLEDPTLEAVKLTQYVTVLRLMNAPSNIVIHKLISAHQNRSLSIIAAFRKQLQLLTVTFHNTITTNTATTTDTFTGNYNNSNEILVTSSTTATATTTTTSTASNNNQVDNLSETRQFHQELVVGLIEACKGIQELYYITDSEIQQLQQHSTSPIPAHHSHDHALSPTTSAHKVSSTNNNIGNSNNYSSEEKETSFSSPIVSNNDHQQQQQRLQAERNQAYSTLVTMIHTVLVEYKSTLFQSFQLFFKRHEYYHHKLKSNYCGML